MTRAWLSSPGARRSDPPPAAHRLRLLPSTSIAVAVSTAALLALSLCPKPAHAQQDTARVGGGWGGVSVSTADAPRAGAKPPDFLFAAPKGSLALRFGMLMPRGNSDAFNEAIRDLTLSRGSFRALTASAELSWRVAPRVDAGLTVGYARSSPTAEYRHFFEYVGSDSVGIFQRTSLAQVPLTVHLKYYVTPPGRQVGHFAWIPARVAPYLGVAGGVVWHNFRQSGDFVDQNAGDPQNRPIYTDNVDTHGWSPTIHAFGGAEVAISRRAALQLEARYAWSSANMGPNFVGFDKLDLAGLQTTVGLSWRY